MPVSACVTSRAMSPLSLDTELRTPSPPTLELGHSLVEELSVHQLTLELQERTDRLSQLDNLAESLVLQVADRDVTIDEQERLIDEQRQLLALSAEKMATLASTQQVQLVRNAAAEKPQSGKVDGARGFARYGVYAACGATFLAVAAGLL